MTEKKFYEIKCNSMYCKNISDMVERRTKELGNCMEICDDAKMERYNKLICEARQLLDEAFEMGLREDN